VPPFLVGVEDIIGVVLLERSLIASGYGIEELLGVAHEFFLGDACRPRPRVENERHAGRQSDYPSRISAHRRLPVPVVEPSFLPLSNRDLDGSGSPTSTAREDTASPGGLAQVQLVAAAPVAARQLHDLRDHVRI